MVRLDRSAVLESVDATSVVAFEKVQLAVHRNENSTKGAGEHAGDARAWVSLGAGGFVRMLAVKVSN